MSDRIEVGKVCSKGHVSWEGSSDHGACASNYCATVYLTVERDWSPHTRAPLSLEEIAESLRGEVQEAEAHMWCGADE